MNKCKEPGFVVTNNLVGIVSRYGGMTLHLFDWFLIKVFREKFDRLWKQGVPADVYLQQNLEQTATQEEYFQRELEHLSQTEYNLRIYGWDTELMNRDPYLEALAQLTQRNNSVAISMVIPEDIDSVKLQEINGANIRRIAQNPDTGYVIFDNNRVSYWDSKRHSLHLPEQDSVIYRLHHTPSEKNRLLLIDHFDKQFATAKK